MASCEGNIKEYCQLSTEYIVGRVINGPRSPLSAKGCWPNVAKRSRSIIIVILGQHILHHGHLSSEVIACKR